MSDEEMQYDLLGDDSSSDGEKIAKYTGDVNWEYLRPHFKNNSMIYVDPTMNLQEVANAFVEDNKEQVQAWLKKADIVKPDNLHAEWWEHDQTRFTAVVITPFVLAQPLAKES